MTLYQPHWGAPYPLTDSTHLECRCLAKKRLSSGLYGPGLLESSHEQFV